MIPVALACLLLVQPPTTARTLDVRVDPASTTGGLVVSVDPIASRVGAEVLAEGGNAVDAAVATALALAVTHPEAGNVGGGGFMLVKPMGEDAYCIDYRETAPALATADMFLDEQGRVDPAKVRIGWLVVGTPGTPHGLWTAHRKAGSLPWNRLVEPAARLAAEGFVVDEYLSRGLAGERADFERFGEAARVFYGADGVPPKAGATLVQPDLADVLRRLRDDGVDGFYRGRTAELLEDAMKKNGGLVRAGDLAGYAAVVRPALTGSYRGVLVHGCPPPASGGVAVIEMLNILGGYDLSQHAADDPRRLHLVVEAMRRAFLDRARHLGDPDFIDMPVERLLSPDYAATLRESIGPRAGDSAALGADILSRPESVSTTHFSVIDAAGTMVANTYTLEYSYGAKVVAPGLGFLLNNEMHDFNVQPGVTTASGQVGTPANLIAPGKRMLSSQTPTLLTLDGHPYMVLGSPGGRTIINTVLQVIGNVVDHGMTVAEAVAAPRLHHQWMPDVVQAERAMPKAAVDGLRGLGHEVVRTGAIGDCHAIWIDPKTGLRHAGVDRRRRGGAAGVDRR